MVGGLRLISRTGMVMTKIERHMMMGEISSERDGTKKMMKNLNIIQISHLTFECS